MQYTKRKFKYSVRQLKRKQQRLRGMKLAQSFSGKGKTTFWSKVRQYSRSSAPSSASMVDGVSDPSSIADLMASRLRNLLNIHSPS